MAFLYCHPIQITVEVELVIENPKYEHELLILVANFQQHIMKDYYILCKTSCMFCQVT